MKRFRQLPLGFLSAVAVLLGVRTAPAQSPAVVWPAEPQRPTVLLDLNSCSGGSDTSKTAAQRVRMFMMPTGGVSDLTVRDIDAVTAEPGTLTPGDDPLSDLRFDLAFNADNPYFDFRLPGDPGGVGYQRYQTAWQLVETADTALSLHCHAVTPAGGEADGLTSGPTWVSPGITCSQRLGSDGGFQAFVSRTMRPQWRGNSNGGGDALDGTTRYGVAIHQPCPLLDGATPGRVFMFMEAVGNLRVDDLVTTPRTQPRLVVLPGLHFQTGTNCWLSGGFMLPVSAGPRTDANLWQVTCSWRF